MRNYIAYLDLLGIKDMAKYSLESYYNTINQFVRKLECCCDIFKKREYTNSYVYYFSDCAFIRCENLCALFDYIINLRYHLISNNNPIMFTAAIGISNTNGKNECFLESEKLNQKIKGISFGNEDLCRVYVLQNNFKGIGVFIDDLVVKECKNEKQKYLSKSFFLPSINSKEPICYFDLRMTKNEMQPVYLENFLKRYHSANLKNKKYGRYYLSYLANWIVSEMYYQKQNKYSIELSLLNHLYHNYYYLVKDLRNHDCNFDLLLFYLLNEFMNLQNNINPNSEFLSIAKVLIDLQSTQKFLNDLTEIPETILSMKNKDKFIEFYQTLLKKEYTI